MVDVIGYLSFGIFTAHITGNIVVIAALLVRGGAPNVAQILAIPAFVIAVAASWLIAKASERRGPALTRRLLTVHLGLLTCVLIFSLLLHPAANAHGLLADADAMLAVCAMACQFALLHLAVPGAPSTAVMTGNLTIATLSLAETLSRSRQSLSDDVPKRLHATLGLIAGFFAGCLVGAAAVSLLSDWAWAFPVVLAAAAWNLGRTAPGRTPQEALVR
jgi:uncharacterized membrane protein YoaK (UPF0700 family)